MKYNLTAATAIVIANMIGVGVFTSLGFQLFDLSNTGSIITLWVLGGIIALLGSFCYAELSASFPRSGGEYHFLRLSFGNAVGFLSGWTSAVVGFAAPIAVAAFAFAKYFNNVVAFPFPTVVAAIGIVVLITIVHSLHLHIGTRFQVVFTIGKILLLILFIIAGIYASTTSDTPPAIAPSGFVANDLLLPGFWVSLIYVSYAYSGWNASAYIVDEIENPIKNVPRSILIGTVLVTLLYVFINYVFMISAPMDEMRGKEDVAHVPATYIFGATGASIVSGMISFFLISAIGSMIIVGPRVIKRIAADYKEFSFFAKTNKNGVPVRSILFQSGIAILLLLTSSFEFILGSIGFILSVFTTLTAIGLMILRVKSPQTERTVKVPLYPVTPVLFILFNVWMMIYLVVHSPEKVVAGIIFVLIGLIVYIILMIIKRRNGSYSTLAIAGILFLFSCQTGKNKETVTDSIKGSDTNQVQVDVAPPFTINPTLDERAAVLAGINKASITDSQTLRAVDGLNAIWEKKNKKMLEPIKTWVKQEALGQSPDYSKKLVFYPFSGPDFEFANAFFTEADEYILCGMEKAGTKDAWLFRTALAPDPFIKAAQTYFYYSDNYGFFRTIDMNLQFEKTGVVDILSLYIKRAGASIGEVSLLHWNAQLGELVSTDSLNVPNVCTFLFRYPSGKVSRLYYFSKDLSDEGFKKDSTWTKWVLSRAANKKMVSLNKAASYLMHRPNFSSIRNFLLNHSNLHVQDDSGISYSTFLESGKPVKYYGRYTRVIPLFLERYQPELAKRYLTDSISDLPFRIGYNSVYQESNLQVFYQ